MSETSDRYGRYELRGELGRGGFATVYRAWDPELHREVALKALLPHLSMDEDIRHRFLAEAQSTAQLHHPNIVTVYAVNQVEDKPYFTMELINGPTLATVIKSDGGLSLARVIEILRGLASALDYLHSRRLVHRDIKASNVMLDAWSRTVLMDFGVARTLDQTQLTRSGVSIGTPEAMAPEQVRGSPVGPAADIYALGVLAYRLLAGRPPFVGETIYVLHAHAYDPPPPLREYRPELPDGVSDAIDAALAKAPQDRPATAEQFVAALSAPLSETTMSMTSARFLPRPINPRTGEPQTPTPSPPSPEVPPVAAESLSPSLTPARVPPARPDEQLVEPAMPAESVPEPPTVVESAQQLRSNAADDALAQTDDAVLNEDAAVFTEQASPPRGVTPVPAHDAPALPLAAEAPKPDRERDWVERTPLANPRVTAATPVSPASQPAADQAESRGLPWARIGLAIAALLVVGAVAVFAITRKGGGKPNNSAVVVASSTTASAIPPGATTTATVAATSTTAAVASVTRAPTPVPAIASVTPPRSTPQPATPQPATPAPPSPPADLVSVLAGSGTAGFQDGAGDQAQFRGPKGVAADNTGVVYVADTDNSRIRRIGADGRVTTIAGPGASNTAPTGYADQPGDAARFNKPRGIVAAKDGTLYVADTENNRIRRIDRNGTVGTIAGSGGTTVGAGGFFDGPGGQARFNLPSGLAIDDSNTLYVADARNNRIRKIDAGGNVTTLAGASETGNADGQGSAARFNAPSAVAADSKGNIYVADTFNGLIRKISADGQVTTYAGGGGQNTAEGPARSVAFAFPEGIAVDAAGNVYVADQTHRVRMITPDGNVVIVAGGPEGFADGNGTQARFNFPSGVALAGDNALYVADSTNNRIRKISLK